VMDTAKLPQRWTLIDPGVEAFRAAIEVEGGHMPSVAERLGFKHLYQIHYLRRRQPEYDAVYRAWVDVYRAETGRVRVFRPLGCAGSDEAIAAALDASTTYREAARRCGYNVPALWAVSKRSDMPLTTAAYARLRARKDAVADPRPRLLRAGIQRIEAALPTHGHITRMEWRAVAETLAATAKAWPKTHQRRVRQHAETEIALAIRLADLIPEPGYASRAMGAHETYVAYLRRDVPEVDAAWRRAYGRAMIRSREHNRRIATRDWWTQQYRPEVRRERARIIDDIMARYGSLGAWERANGGRPTPSRTGVERWIRNDHGLYRPGMYDRRPINLTIRPTCSKAEAREPALILRHTSGDRWWQWGKWVAWVGDHDHSARLMLEHALLGRPEMIRRMERLDAELWTQDGWESDSRMARFDPKAGTVVWRPW
jgi:hypothetical protein